MSESEVYLAPPIADARCYASSVVLLLAILSIGAASMMGTEGHNQSMANGREQWIGLLQALEDNVELLEYEVTLVVGAAESPEEIEDLRPTGQSARSHVLLQRETRRSRIEYERRSDLATDRSIRVVAAFDGTTSTQLHFMGKGRELENYLPPKASIGSSAVLDEDWIPSFAIGLDVFPGFYDRGRGIAHAVQHADEVKIVEKPGSILEIHFLLLEHISPRLEPGVLPHPEGGPCQNWKKVVLDLRRGGIVTTIAEYTCWPNDPNEYTNQILEVQYHQTEDGDWIPRSATDLIGFLSEKTVRKYEYKNVLRNHFDAESHTDRFRVQFDAGTQVLDTRAGISFTVGLRPEELEDAIEQSLEGVAEQMARTEPCQPGERTGTGAGGVVATAERQRVLRSSWLGWLLLAILLCLPIAVGIAWLCRSKAPRTVLLLLLAGSVIVIPEARAEELVIPSPVRPSGYEIAGADGEAIPIDQCGLNCTLFALAFYDRAYNTELVKSALRPDRNGISMQRVKQVLRGYGLGAYGRRLSDMRDLSAVYQERSLIITPSGVRGRLRHYYVVLPAREQSEAGSYLLVDPARSVEIKTTEAILERLADADGVVLVVRERDDEAPPQIQQIRMDSELDFGEFPLSAGMSYQKELILRNTGRLPVVISRIAGSCSCLVTAWTGGLIEPRSERRVAVSISAKTWGAGRKTSGLTVICADGSAKACTVRGTALVPEDQQRIVVTPKELYLDASSGNTETSVKYVYVHQSMDNVRPFKVDTTDNPGWLLVQVLKKSPKDGLGRIAVKLSGETIPGQRAEARFRIFTDDSEEPVNVTVHVSKRKPYALSPRILVVDASRTKHKFTVSLQPDRTPDSVKITDIALPCSEIAVSRCTLADRTPALEVTVSESLVGGLHKIALDLESDNGDQFSEVIHILRIR